MTVNAIYGKDIGDAGGFSSNLISGIRVNGFIIFELQDTNRIVLIDTLIVNKGIPVSDGILGRDKDLHVKKELQKQ